MSYIEKELIGTFFLNGEFQRIYEATSKDFQNLLTLEQFIELGTQFNEGVTSYEVTIQTNVQGITNIMWMDNLKSRIIAVSVDRDNVIQSLYLKPYEIFPNTDQKWTKNKYRMPITEDWFVVWGGANEFLNYHYPYEGQRYAYDLVIVKEDKSYKDSSLSNENYYAFGAEVVAPYRGKVVTVVDGIKDNIPGEMNEQQPAGNYIVIAHPNNEFSMIAHFKMNSIVVKPGDTVKEGQLLGYCGNSGNSSEAHIHFQVMDRADFNKAKSIRIKFQNNLEPIQGDVVEPRPFKDTSNETFDKIDNSLTIGEILLAIPKAIGHFFKSQ